MSFFVKVDGVRVAPGLVDPFTKMAMKFREDTGFSLYVMDGYRTPLDQTIINEMGGTSSCDRLEDPDVSPHSYARAIDVYTDGYNLTNEELNSWLRNNAGGFGFIVRGRLGHLEFSGDLWEKPIGDSPFVQGSLEVEKVIVGELDVDEVIVSEELE